MKKRLLAWSLTVIMVVLSIGGHAKVVEAGVGLTNIRVGLATNYKGKSTLHLGNEAISMGFCVDNKYTQYESFLSGDGYDFKPAGGYFAASKTTYETYAKASEVADKLTDSYNVKAYAAWTGVEKWQIYLGGSSTKADVTKMVSKADGKFSITYGSPANDNKQTVRVDMEDGSFLYDGKAAKMYPQLTADGPNGDGVFTLLLGQHEYRGRLEIGAYGSSSVSAVGVLPVDDYLYGVVPAEMVSSWPAEALKAQAVVARTYAVYKTGYDGDSNITSPYRINDTTSSQVYKGYGGEAASTNKAVDATAGKLIYSGGKLIESTFFSTSGGATANSEDVWGSPISYLRSVPDIYELEPEKAPWTMSVTKSTIVSKAAARGVSVGTIRDLVPEIRSEQGYMVSLKIMGDKENFTLQRDSIRSFFGLYSNKFKIIAKGDVPDQVRIKSKSTTKSKQISKSYVLSADGKAKAKSLEQYVVLSADNLTNFPRTAPTDADTYTLAGMGYGHGVGLSQSGAKGMAKAGYTYKEIIKHYYSDVSVQ